MLGKPLILSLALILAGNLALAQQDDEPLVIGHHLFGGADKLFSHASS